MAGLQWRVASGAYEKSRQLSENESHTLNNFSCCFSFLGKKYNDIIRPVRGTYKQHQQYFCHIFAIVGVVWHNVSDYMLSIDTIVIYIVKHTFYRFFISFSFFHS